VKFSDCGYLLICDHLGPLNGSGEVKYAFCVVGSELSTLRKENRKSMLVSFIILTAVVVVYLTFTYN